MKKYKSETTVGIFVLAGLFCIGFMTIKLGNISLFNDSFYTLTAKFTSVSGLKKGNQVEMFGIHAGHVKGLTMDQEFQNAVVELNIKKGIKVYDDAIASIKTSGLIGDKYIQLHPGGSGDELKPGGTIMETEAPTDIMDLIGKYAFGDVGGSDEGLELE